MTIYTDNGHADRQAYLESLAEEYDVDYASVVALSTMLGPNEDFDGLVAELEDFSTFML